MDRKKLTIVILLPLSALCLIVLGMVSTYTETSTGFFLEKPARIQVKESIITAKIQKASDLMRSIQAPQTMDATVQETARTYLPMRAVRSGVT